MADTPLLSHTSDTETTETTISIVGDNPENANPNPENANPTAPEAPAAVIIRRIKELMIDWIRNANALFAYVGNIVTLLFSLPNIWVAIALLLVSAIVALGWTYHAHSRWIARDSLAPSMGPGPNTRAPATGYMELLRDWIRNYDVPLSYLGNMATLVFSPKELWLGITLLCGFATIAFIQTCCNSLAQVEPPAHIQAQPQDQPPAHVQPRVQVPSQVQPAQVQPQVQAPAQGQLQQRRALRRANSL